MTMKLAILGSTGSIGTQALQVVDRLREGGLDVAIVALAAGENVELLAKQAAKYRPAVVATASKSKARDLRAAVPESIEVLAGPDAAATLAGDGGSDTVVQAIVGAAGLGASFAAAAAGKKLCLANKESLVCAGRLLTGLARERGVTLLPIDSEHSAIFQALRAGRREEVSRVFLTASGGPFRDATAWPADRLAVATVEQALDHPTWAMGGKNTVDSATLFNKALELIETVVLFDVPHERIEVVIHPQSVVHSMVEFADGSTIAQLSPPDMRMPIGYAIAHPRRLDGGARRLDFSAAQSLDFEPPDLARFPAIALARRALDSGGTMPLAFNVANEVAVAAFFARCLHFGGIAEVVARTMDHHTPSQPGSLNDLRAAIDETTALARQVAAFVGR